MTHKQKEAIATLQAAITEGVASGKLQPFDAAVYKLRMREKLIASLGLRIDT